MATFLNLLLALLIIGIIIFIHELGHYLAARATGISVVEFAMGFGPRLVSWRRGRTNYSIRLLVPLGGFCMFAGEDEAEHWYAAPYVAGFLPGSPAEAAGLRAGDVITRIGDTDIPFAATGGDAVAEELRTYGLNPVTITVRRSGELNEFTVRAVVVNGEATFGIRLGRVNDMAVARAVDVEPGSGILPGDLIVKVGRRYINHAPSGAFAVQRALEKADGQPLPITVDRNGRMVSLTCAPVGLVLGDPSEDFLRGGEPEGAIKMFNKQPVWRRIVTVFSGPFMNFVLAVIAAIALVMVLGFTYARPMVAEVVPGMNAEAAGMQANDRIVEIDGIAVEDSGEGTMQLLRALNDEVNPARDHQIVVERSGERVPLTIAPSQTEDGSWQIGIFLAQGRGQRTLGEAVPIGFQYVRRASLMIVDALRALVTTGEGADQTAGPVGLVSIMTEEVEQGGFETVLNLIVIISVNLGIMNLLPLPALDGGRLVFLIVEGIRRKPVKPEREAWIHAAGFLLFMGLFVVLTYRDIARLIGGGWS